MKQRQSFDLNTEVREALKGKQVPILVLDSRWHTLFPKGDKPEEICHLEARVNELLKRQGFLVNDLKKLKKTKKKLMDGIVAGMGDDDSLRDKKAKNQKRLLLEIKERIQEESDELLELPHAIQRANEDLLMAGASYCFERLSKGDKQLNELNAEIIELREILKQKIGDKADLEESMESAYSLLHGLLGHDVMNLYDKRKDKE